MYRALYRKWRPQTFSDVSGQEHITGTLMNEVASGRLSHAYLFTGSRGTGKTTCAKILSKAVNCLNPVNGNPCNECAICRGIDDGSVLDVTEIDAASNNGVDNIRDLREEANFTPAAAKYRVYIIDEVHMLSTGAFNALLKTLEEPPEHVLFILATTEVQKVPSTILSRCQRFDFRRISPEDISARLLTVAENEGIELDTDAALLIARIADGALRDALSVLDQCAGTGSRVDINTVSSCAGLLGKEYLFELSDAITAENSARVLEIVDKLHSSSCDMERLLNELVNHFRNIMIAKTAKKPEDFIVCTPEELVKYKQLASELNYGTVLYIMETLCKESSAIKYSAHRRAQVETLLIRLCTPSLSTDGAALAMRIDELEAQIRSLKANGFSAAPVNTPVQNTPVQSAPATAAHAAPEKVPAAPAAARENTVQPEKKTETAAEKPEKPADNLQSAKPLQSSVSVTPEPVQTRQKADNSAVSAEHPAAEAQTVDYAVVTDSDKALPFTAWENTMTQLSNIAKPLHAILLGSTAFRAGNAVFIKAKNSAFNQLFNVAENKRLLSDALARATGEKLTPMIYREGSSPAAEEAVEPVDALIAKLRKMNIDFTLEE